MAELRALFEEFRASMAYIEVKNRDGDVSIGTAFHVGDGVFVTARHVIDGNTITEIASTNRTFIDAAPDEHTLVTVVSPEGTHRRVHLVQNRELTLSAGPFFHPDSNVDVACFRVDGADPRTPAIPLGSHLDDWLGDDDFTLSSVLVLGYPPVPMANGPILLAARGEVSAVIDPRHHRHPHFIVSVMPRGGFSGGVALSEWGFALGIVVQSLLTDGKPPELGFLTVLSVEPIYVCLAEHYMLPACQSEEWNGLWNTDTVYFMPPDDPSVRASISIFDDGKTQYLEIHSQHISVDAAVGVAAAALGSDATVDRKRDDWYRLTAAVGIPRASMKAAARAIAATFATLGLRRGGSDRWFDESRDG